MRRLAASIAAAGRPARRGGGSSGARLGAVARVRARNKATDDRLQPCCSERRCRTVALAAPRPLLLSMAAGAAAALSLLLLLLLLLRGLWLLRLLVSARFTLRTMLLAVPGW